MSHLKQETYDSMAWRTYKNEIHKWGFYSFVTNMDYNHMVLSEYGEPVHKGTKFSNFLRGVKFPIMSRAKCTTIFNHTIIFITL